jgi:hypothetical protein
MVLLKMEVPSWLASTIDPGKTFWTHLTMTMKFVELHTWEIEIFLIFVIDHHPDHFLEGWPERSGGYSIIFKNLGIENTVKAI